MSGSLKRERKQVTAQLASGRIVSADLIESGADVSLVSYAGLPAQYARLLSHEDIVAIEAAAVED